MWLLGVTSRMTSLLRYADKTSCNSFASQIKTCLCVLAVQESAVHLPWRDYWCASVEDVNVLSSADTTL